MTSPEQPQPHSSTSRGQDVPDELHRWVAGLCDALGVDPQVIDVEGLLDVTREVAHGVVRPAVPVTAYLMGYAVGASGPDHSARYDALAEQIRELVRGWR